MCKHSKLVLYWTWKNKIHPFGKRVDSIRQLVLYGINIDTCFNINFKNETLLNTKFRSLTIEKLQLLIDNNFDFVAFANLPNAVGDTPLTALSSYADKLSTLKLFYHHCNQLQGFDLNILHCNAEGWNALHNATKTHFTTMQFLLSNVYFPNNSKTNETGKIAINWQNKDTKDTPAHRAARGKRVSNVKHLQLLHKYGCNFNIFNKQGYQPIHVACECNAYFPLSWIIQSNIYQNCSVLTKTRETPLKIAIKQQSVECVEILCKHTNVKIDKTDIFDTIKIDNSAILKQLLCTLFEQHNITDWRSIFVVDDDSPISHKVIVRYVGRSKNRKCAQLMNDLMKKGYRKCNYHYIAHRLDYNAKSVINSKINRYTLRIEDKYSIKEKLGGGAFGQVKYAVNKQTKQKVAIKYILLKSDMSQQFISTEIGAISKITHKNVIRLIDYDVRRNRDGTVALVFEYAPFGELYQFLSRVNYFDFHIAFIYFEQILSGLQACHIKNIAHRDLKGQNILLSSTFQIKIADFGLASIINDSDNKEDEIYNVGTPV